MSTFYDRASSTGIGAAALMVSLAVLVGVALGLLTKAALWLYSIVIELVWEWLPEQLGLDTGAFLFMAVVLVIGGLLVGLGQRRLGYLPKPLEETVSDVSDGKGLDYRTIPAVLANTLPSLGAGAPLGPEAGLIAVIGGVYYWLKERMDQSATRAFRLMTGNAEDEASRPWRFAPTIISGVTVIAVFHALPGGTDLSFVPRVTAGSEVQVLVLALAAGLLAGVLGIGARRLEQRARQLRLFEVRNPLLVAPLAGLAVAVLAVPTSLVLFSGSEDMAVLFSRGTDAGELLYAGAAKLVAMLIVVAAGWKGGTIFPLMFIAGALAVGAADVTGLDPAVLYAAAIAGAVAAHLRSVPLGAIVALLVVPSSLLVVIVVGAAGAAITLRAMSRTEAQALATEADGR